MPTGELTLDPKIIFDTFLTYYSNLYAPIPAYNMIELKELLTDLPIATLLVAEVELLDKDLTLEEIELASDLFPLTSPLVLWA